MTCIYGCQKDGTPCPRPHTCHTLGPKLASQLAADEQAKTDRQEACCTGNCHQGRDCPARRTPAKATEQAAQFQDDTEELDSDIGEIVLDGIAAALIVWLVACVFAPALAGYLSHMKG